MTDKAWTMYWKPHRCRVTERSAIVCDPCRPRFYAALDAARVPESWGFRGCTPGDGCWCIERRPKT